METRPGEQIIQDYLTWLDGEIARIESGGDPPPCFTGTRAECVASMRAERKALTKDPRAFSS